VHANACVQADGAVSVLGIDGQDGSVDVSLPQGGKRVVEQSSADSSPPCCREDAEFIDRSAGRVAGCFRVADAEGNDLPVFNGKEPQRRMEVVFAHPVPPLVKFRFEPLIKVSEVVGERWCFLRLRRTRFGEVDLHPVEASVSRERSGGVRQGQDTGYLREADQGDGAGPRRKMGKIALLQNSRTTARDSEKTRGI